MELYLIYQTGEDLEPEWKPLQGSPLLDPVTVVSKEVLDHVLHGFSFPFVQQLGPSPEGCVRKLLPVFRQCAQRERCIFYDRVRCVPTSRKMPNCYQPDGVEGEAVSLGAEIVRLWHENVYIVVVQE